MSLETPRVGGDWLSYSVAIAALNAFKQLVIEWGAIEITLFAIVCHEEVKATLELALL